MCICTDSMHRTLSFSLDQLVRLNTAGHTWREETTGLMAEEMLTPAIGKCSTLLHSSEHAAQDTDLPTALLSPRSRWSSSADLQDRLWNCYETAYVITDTTVHHTPCLRKAEALWLRNEEEALQAQHARVTRSMSTWLCQFCVSGWLVWRACCCLHPQLCKMRTTAAFSMLFLGECEQKLKVALLVHETLIHMSAHFQVVFLS